MQDAEVPEAFIVSTGPYNLTLSQDFCKLFMVKRNVDMLSAQDELVVGGKKVLVSSNEILEGIELVGFVKRHKRARS